MTIFLYDIVYIVSLACESSRGCGCAKSVTLCGPETMHAENGGPGREGRKRGVLVLNG